MLFCLAIVLYHFIQQKSSIFYLLYKTVTKKYLIGISFLHYLQGGESAVVNDSPVDCQSRDVTEPQREAGA